MASEVIEGACRHLMKDRLDITGARWSRKGAAAVLRLRSLRRSGDGDEDWRFHEAKAVACTHPAPYGHGIPRMRQPASGAGRPPMRRAVA